MIKNRSFMFGLGTGLISGALLLQVMISGGAAPSLTKEELVQQAAKLNLTVTDPAADPQASLEPSAQVTEPAGQTDNKNKPEASDAASTPSPVPSAAASPEAAVQPSAAAAPTEPAVPSKPVQSAGTAPEAPATPQAALNGVVAVRIPAGSTLTETAQLLAKAGVIKEQTEFLKTAMSRKINAKIQYGSYNFTKGESVNSIIEKLITVK
ncbi:endolytic transglycosylase MltG [Paenibacillus ihuae]|uniref:endolytic transglycosylase MltG n=1 Tax=Paenibacillus ihuae TaxID=1232431 RepID=UPI0006D5B44B|nr:endolytic transglycosylase MltG [Paenibacillus ihuae]